MKTEKQAQQAGQLLLGKMRGTGWKLRVWENLGWHYSVSAGPVCVHESADGGFFALVSDDPEKAGPGASFWTRPGGYTDPNRAVRAAVRRAVELTTRLVAVCQAARQATGAKNRNPFERKTGKKA